MHSEPTDRRLILASVDRLVRQLIEPRSAEIDRTGLFPRDIYKGMVDLGLIGLWIPSEYGGTASDLQTILLVLERVSRASAACALLLSNTFEATMPIIAGGSEAVRSQYLPRILDGSVIPCFSLTESDAGSDAAAISASATRVGSSYAITGRKVFCTNGSVGGAYVVFAKTDVAPGPRGISAFLVPRDGKV